MKKKISDIASGFFFWLTGQHAAMRKKRMAICLMCEHKSTLGTCGVCGCVLKAKTSVRNQTCPHPNGPKWNAE